MSCRRGWSLRTLALLAVAAVACGEPPHEAAAPAAARPVPVVEDLESLDPGVARAFARAVERVRRAPDNGAAWGELGILYHAHKYIDLARQAYAAACDLAPDSPEWSYLAGVLAEDRGDMASARRLYGEALARTPSYAAARYRLGNVELAAGDTAAARASFDLLAEELPDQPWGDLGLARLARREGRTEEAVERLEAARELAPDNLQVRFLLASAYREAGRAQEAEPLLEGLAAGVRPTAPGDPWLDRVRGGLRTVRSRARAAHDALAAGDLATGRRLYEEVLELDPEHYDALFNLGVLAGRERRFDDALAYLDRAVAVRPEDAEAHYVRALTLGSLQRYDEAREEVAKVLEIDPGHAGARQLLDPSPP